VTTNALGTAVFQKLTADSTLGAMLAGTAAVYQGQAPQGAGLPYVVFNQQAETDNYTLATRAFEEYVILVKGVTKATSPGVAGAISSRIDEVLTDGSLTVAGQAQMYLRREQQIKYPEIDSGETYWHSGGLFRIVVQ
jgi:hypothetical protein